MTHKAAWFFKLLIALRSLRFACKEYSGCGGKPAGADALEENRIHPGDAMDKNLYDLPPEELRDIPTVCGSLREALTELQADHAFLMKGDVFSRDFVESYIELKWEEVYNFEHTPHPIEFQMYYSI